MSQIKIKQAVPSFSARATSERIINLSDYKDKSHLVLYFYPKDSTPGCTTEGQDFRDVYSQFQDHDTEIIGVSRDSMKHHENFKAKQSFPFELIADEEGEICKLFNVWQTKQTFGKQYMGIVRSTFLIDKQGILRQEWLNVRVKNHVAEVLEAVKTL